MQIISIKGLTKSFGSIRAVKGIDLNIDKGEFFGLLGPNGAGKTTTINILSTVMKPDEGEISINGFDLKKEPARCKQSIGIVPQELALYEELTARENLVFWGSMYGIPKATLQERADTLLDLFELSERKNSMIKTFSGGMKRRINIAAAMLHEPEILLMDEPTVGVDPQSRNKIYDVLAKFSDDGITIIYTTHYMDEVEKLCNRIGIIDHGEIIARGTLDELRKLTGADQHIVIHYEKNGDQGLMRLKEAFGESLTIDDDKIIFAAENVSRDLPVLIKKCTEHCKAITHIEIEKSSLEQVFLNLTGRKLRDQ